MHARTRASRLLAMTVSVAAVLTLVPSVAAHVEQLNPIFSATTDYRGRMLGNPRFRIETQRNPGYNDTGYVNYDIALSSTPTCATKYSDTYLDLQTRQLDANGNVLSNWTTSNNIPGSFFCMAAKEYPYHMGRDSIGWLKPGYKYFDFRFRGNVAGTIYMLARTTANFDPPPTPTDFAPSQVTPCSIRLTWTDVVNETSYELQRSDGNDYVSLTTLPKDTTEYIHKGLEPGRVQVYRLRAVNSIGVSPWTGPAIADTAPAGPCDSDGDGLDDADERALGTSVIQPDTDGDGLLDPWEVQHPDIDGDGFVLNGYPEPMTATRDEVFGPYGGDECGGADGELRMVGRLTCFNAAPTPLRKDVFLEMDWQDCTQGNCPDVDDTHHAPDLDGLRAVYDAFANAPVTNPDGTRGVELNLLVDEAVPHEPNCDRGSSATRSTNFGTVTQRHDPNAEAILAARTLAVRYAWSGHSSAQDHGTGVCPSPSLEAMGATGMGMRPLDDYDWTPYGDANIGGRDILVTLGPVWSCPWAIGGWAWTHPCYRQYSGRVNYATGRISYDATFPGIFPNSIDVGSQNVSVPFPIARLLGLTEEQGITQLWSRTLMHLLGHSLGLATDAEVRNVPDTPGVDRNGDGVRDPLPPETFSSWSSLVYAPTGDGVPAQSLLPNYAPLVNGDPDGDGIAEGDDICPGVFNPGDPDQGGSQPDSDLDRWGDPCDPDSDGDGMSESSSAGASPGDPSPFDTDNDRVRNSADPDIDGDGIANLFDNCVIQPNRRQRNRDADRFGNACDMRPGLWRTDRGG